jgi:hypothetical protein
MVVNECLACRLQRCKHELEQQQASTARLRTTLDMQQRDAATISERDRQTNNKNKLLNNKLKAEKEEVGIKIKSGYPINKRQYYVLYQSIMRLWFVVHFPF